LNNKLAHAEMLGLQNSQEILLANKRQATLYTTYEPCPMCFGGIILSRIKRVVAGVDLDQSGAMYFRENLPLLFKQKKFCVDFFPGVLAEECSRVFMKSEMAREMEKNGLIKKVLL
jgi:tRNA(adenine34) deaminase